MSLIGIRCVIPASDLLKGQDLFTVDTVPTPCWTRSYFSFENALRPGLLDWKTRIAQANAPPPDGLQGKDEEFVRYNTTIQVGQTGNYELDSTTSQLTVVKVDGRIILNFIFPYTQNFHYSGPGKTQVKSFQLTQGSHDIEITASATNTNTLPNVNWRHAGDKNPGTPIWSSFNWQ